MRGLVVVLWPGEDPKLAEIRLGDHEYMVTDLLELLGHTDAMTLFQWGPGLIVAIDADSTEKDLAGNVAMACVGMQGEPRPPLYVVGPLVVYAADPRGQARGMSVEEAEDVMVALALGQHHREVPCPWASSSRH